MNLTPGASAEATETTEVVEEGSASEAMYHFLAEKVRDLADLDRDVLGTHVESAIDMGDQVAGTDMRGQLDALRQVVESDDFVAEYGESLQQELREAFGDEEKAQALVERVQAAQEEQWRVQAVWETEVADIQEKIQNLVPEVGSGGDGAGIGVEEITEMYIDEAGEAVPTEEREAKQQAIMKRIVGWEEVKADLKELRLWKGGWRLLRGIWGGMMAKRAWAKGEEMMRVYEENKALVQGTRQAVSEVQEARDAAEEELGTAEERVQEGAETIKEKAQGAADVVTARRLEQVKPRMPYSPLRWRNVLERREAKFMRDMDRIYAKHGKTAKAEKLAGRLTKKFGRDMNRYGIQIMHDGGGKAKLHMERGYYKQYKTRVIMGRVGAAYVAGNIVKFVKEKSWEEQGWGGALKEAGREMVSAEGLKRGFVPFYETGGLAKELWKNPGAWQNWAMLGIDLVGNVGYTASLLGVVMSAGAATPVAAGVTAARAAGVAAVRKTIQKSAAKGLTEVGQGAARSAAKNIARGVGRFGRQTIYFTATTALLQEGIERAMGTLETEGEALYAEAKEEFYSAAPGLPVLEEGILGGDADTEPLLLGEE